MPAKTRLATSNRHEPDRNRQVRSRTFPPSSIRSDKPDEASSLGYKRLHVLSRSPAQRQWKVRGKLRMLAPRLGPAPIFRIGGPTAGPSLLQRPVRAWEPAFGPA